MRKKVSIFLLVLLASTLALFMPSAVRAKTITIDGDPSDWTGTPPAQENNWTISAGEFIWRDAVGDDTGNGSWTYPTSALFTGGEADLTELRMTWDSNYLYLLIKVASMDYANLTAIGFTIDTDRVSASGQEWFPGYSDAKITSVAYWEWAWEFAAAKNDIFDTGWISQGAAVVANSTTNNCFEVGFPISVIGTPTGFWRFGLIIGLHSDPVGDTFTEVKATATATSPGGGDELAWEDPDAFDAAFFATTADQEANFKQFTPGVGPIVLSAYMDVDMPVIPEFPLPYSSILIAATILLALFVIKKRRHL